MTPKSSKERFDSFLSRKIAFGDSRTMFISDSNNDRILVTELASPFEAKVIDKNRGSEQRLRRWNFRRGSTKQASGHGLFRGALFIADTENHAIRKADFREKYVTTIAGDGFQGFSWQYSGEASKARLNSLGICSQTEGTSISPWPECIRSGGWI